MSLQIKKRFKESLVFLTEFLDLSVIRLYLMIGFLGTTVLMFGVGEDLLIKFFSIDVMGWNNYHRFIVLYGITLIMISPAFIGQCHMDYKRKIKFKNE